MNQLVNKRGMYGCNYFEDGAYSTERNRRASADYPRLGNGVWFGVLGDVGPDARKIDNSGIVCHTGIYPVNSERQEK